MTEPAKPASRRAAARPGRKPKAGDPEVTDTKATEPTSAPVVEAGPVAVHVDAGEVKVVVAPPGSKGIDRRLYRLINGLPHTTTSDRYVSVLSDLGEGLGWVAGGIALATLGGPKGRRAGAATAAACEEERPGEKQQTEAEIEAGQEERPEKHQGTSPCRRKTAEGRNRSHRRRLSHGSCQRQ